MKIIKYFYIIVAAYMISFIAMPAHANSLEEKRPMKEDRYMQNQASKTAQFQEKELQNIIKRADMLIAKRLTSLNHLNSRIQNDKKLTSDEKTNLTSEIQNAINGLTALKTKIDAATDVNTARSDAKQIITNYYIYSMFEPKIRLLITINNLQTTSTNLQAVISQIQNLINTWKSQGKDTSKMEALLNDASSQLQTINTTLSTDKTAVQNVSTSTSEPGSIFKQVREDITKIVHQDFKKIRTDLSQIRPLFKKDTSSPSATTTLSPTQ